MSIVAGSGSGSVPVTTDQVDYRNPPTTLLGRMGAYAVNMIDASRVAASVGYAFFASMSPYYRVPGALPQPLPSGTVLEVTPFPCVVRSGVSCLQRRLLPSFLQKDSVRKLKDLRDYNIRLNKVSPKLETLLSKCLPTFVLDQVKDLSRSQVSWLPKSYRDRNFPELVGFVSSSSDLPDYMEYSFKRVVVRFLSTLDKKDKDRSLVADLGQRVTHAVGEHFKGVHLAHKNVNTYKQSLKQKEEELKTREKAIALLPNTLSKQQAIKQFLKDKEAYEKELRLAVLEHMPLNHLHPAFVVDYTKEAEEVTEQLKAKQLAHCEQWGAALYDLLLPDGIDGLEADLPRDGTLRSRLEPLIRDGLPLILHQAIEDLSDPMKVNEIIELSIDQLETILSAEAGDGSVPSTVSREIRKLPGDVIFPGLGSAIIASGSVLTPQLKSRLSKLNRVLSGLGAPQFSDIIDKVLSKQILELLSQQNIESWLKEGMPSIMQCFDAEGHFIDDGAVVYTPEQREASNRRLNARLSKVLNETIDSALDEQLSLSYHLDNLNERAQRTQGIGGFFLTLSHVLIASIYYPLRWILSFRIIRMLGSCLGKCIDFKKHAIKLTHSFINTDKNVADATQGIRQNIKTILYSVVDEALHVLDGSYPVDRRSSFEPQAVLYDTFLERRNQLKIALEKARTVQAVTDRTHASETISLAWKDYKKKRQDRINQQRTQLKKRVEANLEASYRAEVASASDLESLKKAVESLNTLLRDTGRGGDDLLNLRSLLKKMVRTKSSSLTPDFRKEIVAELTEMNRKDKRARALNARVRKSQASMRTQQ